MRLAAMVIPFVMSGCQFFGSNGEANTVKMLETVPGQLFCQVDSGAGATTVGIIDATAASLPQPGGIIAIVATNATATIVQADCALAAAAVGAKIGIPVVPPASAVGNVAIVPAPGSPTKAVS